MKILPCAMVLVCAVLTGGSAHVGNVSALFGSLTATAAWFIIVIAIDEP